MTNSIEQSATIIPFPAKQPPLPDATLELMARAESTLDMLTAVFDIEAGNLREGANLSAGGSILSGRAMQHTAALLAQLIALRGHRPEDRALAKELFEWLQARRKSHG